MAPQPSLVSAYNSFFFAISISFSIAYLVVLTPIVSPFDHDSLYPLANHPLGALAFSSAVFTYFLAMADLLFRFATPINSDTAKRVSLLTLWAACATLLLGALFVMKTQILDSLDMCAGGGQGAGGAPIQGNAFM
jgi:predicted membrane protein